MYKIRPTRIEVAPLEEVKFYEIIYRASDVWAFAERLFSAAVDCLSPAFEWMSLFRSRDSFFCLFFFFNDTATTEIYTLSLHDALPISAAHPRRRRNCRCSPRSPA